MLKKLLVSGAAVVVVGVLLFGTDAYSYLWTSASKVRTEVKSHVPMEFEIDRARALVADLIPDIQKNMHVIAQEEVEVDDLRDQIARTEKNLNDERQRLLAIRSDLDNGTGKFHYAGRKANGQEIRTELSRRFERFKTAEATLKAKQQMLDARERSLAGARSKLEGMLAARRDLEVQVQNLEARLKMVQAAQTTSEFQFDESRLSRCKKLVQELRKRLDVAQRIVEQDGKLMENMSIEPEAPEDIAEQVDRYFGAAHGSTVSGRAVL